MQKLIGRKREVAELMRSYASGRSEFIIVYGRRRIGKTFLVDHAFRDQYSFCFVGGHRLSKTRQLQNFAKALKSFGSMNPEKGMKDWYDAFDKLEELLDGLPREKRKVIFFDEMPWIDTHRSDFVKALENFWNGWAALRDDICLIASGSATSWMADKLIANQGGLHNRITQQLYLRPFSLNETEQYLDELGCNWDRYQILQAYMIFGGVPFYLSLINPALSLAQNVDDLFFRKNAILEGEFDELYHALFTEAELYIRVVKSLGDKREGLTRKEISEASRLQGSTLSRILANLERCDLIESCCQFKHTFRNAVYRLTDMYTLFYFKFIEGRNLKDEHHWTHLLNSPKVNVWQGITFEIVCMLHLEQIKRSLGIDGVATEVSTWRGEGGQIDLVIDRADRIINLCEMKFSREPYIISKEYEDRLRKRMALFRHATGTRKGLVITFITAYGVLPGKHSGIVQNEVKMDDLFA